MPNMKLPTLFFLIVISSTLVMTAAATDFSGIHGYFSTNTIVSGKCTMNETISVQYTAINNSVREKTEWVNSYIVEDPQNLAWSSKMNVGTRDGNLWWNLQSKGLPAPLITKKIISFIW